MEVLKLALGLVHSLVSAITKALESGNPTEEQLDELRREIQSVIDQLNFDYDKSKEELTKQLLGD